MKELQEITGITPKSLYRWRLDGFIGEKTDCPRNYRMKGIDLFNYLTSGKAPREYEHTAKRLILHLKLGEAPKEILCAYMLGDL